MQSWKNHVRARLQHRDQTEKLPYAGVFTSCKMNISSLSLCSDEALTVLAWGHVFVFFQCLSWRNGLKFASKFWMISLRGEKCRVIFGLSDDLMHKAWFCFIINLIFKHCFLFPVRSKVEFKLGKTRDSFNSNWERVNTWQKRCVG